MSEAAGELRNLEATNRVSLNVNFFFNAPTPEAAQTLFANLTSNIRRRVAPLRHSASSVPAAISALLLHSYAVGQPRLSPAPKAAAILLQWRFPGQGVERHLPPS